MKKMTYVAAFALAMGLAACGGGQKKQAAEPAEEISDAEEVTETAEEVAGGCIKVAHLKHKFSQLKADRMITGKLFGIPLMILLFGLIFWITISGANYPSALLNNLFNSLIIF